MYRSASSSLPRFLKANILQYLSSKLKEEKRLKHLKDDSSSLRSPKQSLRREQKIITLAIYSVGNSPKPSTTNLDLEAANSELTIHLQLSKLICSQALIDLAIAIVQLPRLPIFTNDLQLDRLIIVVLEI